MSTEDIQDETLEANEPQEWRFTIWHSIGLMVLFGVLQGWIYVAISRGAHVDLKSLSWIHFVLMNGIAGAVTIWAGTLLTGYSLSGALAAGKIDASEALFAALTIAGVSILSQEMFNVLQWFLPLPDELGIGDRFMSENLAGVLLMVAVVAPVTEELIFRGLILDGLRRSYRLQTAIFVSALLFALVHDHPWSMVNAFILGLLFALIRLRTGSLLLCILVHSLYNALPFLLARVLSVHIQGYTDFSDAAVQFQPLWFDALGVALTALGLTGLRLAANTQGRV